MTSLPLGAILAGGQNRRYGAHKALEVVGGEAIIARVRRALLTVTPDLVLIANEPEPYRAVGLPIRPDARQGFGVLGGILTALLWAREEGRSGALIVACDMPFLSPALLARLVVESGGADVVVPESSGRRGVEPLCAWYGVACIPAIEAAIGRGERHVISFFDAVRVHRIPLSDVDGYGDPAVLFMNVNTPEERERAERLVGDVLSANAASGGGGA